MVCASECQNHHCAPFQSSSPRRRNAVKRLTKKAGYKVTFQPSPLKERCYSGGVVRVVLEAGNLYGCTCVSMYTGI